MKRKMRRIRLRRVLPVGLLLLLGAWGCIRFIPPASFKAVKDPRAGQAVNQRVAVVYSKHYQINLGGLEKLHPFDINKYARIYLALNTEGLVRPEDVFVPEPLSEADLRRVHTPLFEARLKDSRQLARWLEVPALGVAPAALVDAGMLGAFRAASGGTILAGREAIRHGIAVNIGGGYHHAKPDAGEGFNVFADMAIAIRRLQADGLIRRATIVDLDVHQGNGSAVIFAGDDSVFTFSIHEDDIFPVPKETSDLDVELPAGTDDEAYLAALAKHLPGVLARSRPDIVFLQAGCDTLAGDPLARMKMTPDGIVRRDAMVIDACADSGIPVVMVLGGGYSPNAWWAQFASVKRTILKYGPAGGPTHPPRPPTKGERGYTK